MVEPCLGGSRPVLSSCAESVRRFSRDDDSHHAARLVRAPHTDWRVALGPAPSTMSARVSGLTIYPVKSCSGVHVDAAVLTETGLRFDRAWMVVEDRPKKPSSARRGRRRAKPRASMFLSQRVEPRLALVTATLPPEVLDPSWDGLHLPSGAALVISAPTMHRNLTIPLAPPAPLPRLRVGVWEWTGNGGDEGDDAAAWFTEYLGRPARLARWLGAGGLPPVVADPARGDLATLPARVALASAAALAGFVTHRAVDARFQSSSRGGGGRGRGRFRLLAETFVKMIGAAAATMAHDAAVAFVARRATPRRRCEAAFSPRGSDASANFSDGFPLLFAGEASLAAINALVSEPAPMNRFRPNVVFAGAGAFEEDAWRRVEVNGVGMDFVKPCARCVMTTVDQKRPERGALTKEPYATLERVRNGKACGFAREEWNESAFFAWNVVADRTETGKTIRVGDVVEVTRRRQGSEF